MVRHSKPAFINLRSNQRLKLSTVVAIMLAFVGFGSLVVLHSNASVCSLSAKLVPSCGALWGFYIAGNGDIQPDEATMGRQFDIVHSYHDFSDKGNNGQFPSALEKTYIAGGRTMLFAWETRAYSGYGASMPAPAGTTPDGHQVFTYNQITSGALDTYIDAQAGRFKAIGKPEFISFDHEADLSTQLGGSNADRGVAGSAAEFVAAWRHIHDRFVAVGATNIVWVWTMSGSVGSNSTYSSLYPGDAYVDWVGWDPYNFYSCGGRTTWKDVPATFSSFYGRLDANMIGAGGATKPRMLPEFGSHDDPANATRNGDWYRSLVGYLKTDYPKIKALVVFSSTGICATHVINPPSQADTQAGFKTAGLDPYLNHDTGTTATPLVTPAPTPVALVGDLNDDSKVNVFDLSLLLNQWNATSGTADINRDGHVNIYDLSQLLSHWTG